MKRFLLPVVLLFLASALAGCEDENDITPIDLNLLAGTWEIVSSDTDRNCIYEITTAPDFKEGNYGGYYGSITTYYLTATGNPLYDKEYNWSIQEMENHQPLLKLTLTGYLDGDEPQESNYYRITKLTDTHMWWQSITVEDNTTIMFRRRTDLENR